METANAFDLLIWPMLLCTGAMIVGSAILQMIWAGLDRLIGGPQRTATRSVAPPVGRRFDRPRVLARVGSR